MTINVHTMTATTVAPADMAPEGVEAWHAVIADGILCYTGAQYFEQEDESSLIYIYYVENYKLFILTFISLH